MPRNKNTAAITWCEECQKLLYTDRRRARKVGREHHPHKNAYPCPVRPDLYHVGDLPGPIKQGHVTRDEFFGGIA